MRYGLVASNIGSFSKPANVVQLAEQAEAAGWEALLLWDHLAWVWDGPAVDPWVTLGAVAVRTERLLLGTCVTPVPRRRPQVLALQVATLDELSRRPRRFSARASAATARSSRSSARASTRNAAGSCWRRGSRSSVSSGPARSARARSRSGSAATARVRGSLAARYDGWLPDSTSLDEMTMTPDDVRNETQHEVGVMGYSEAGQHDLHETYAQAGTTWWLEHVHDRRGSFDELLARVAPGPRAAGGSSGGSSSARRRWRTLRERTPTSLPSSTTGTRSRSSSSSRWNASSTGRSASTVKRGCFGDVAQGRLPRVAPGGNDLADERRPRHHPDEPAAVVGHEHRADVRLGEPFSGLGGGRRGRQRGGLCHHRLANERRHGKSPRA